MISTEQHVSPQGGSVCDGEQRDAGVLGSLENLSLHVDAHSAGAFIQQGVFGPGTNVQGVEIISLIQIESSISAQSHSNVTICIFYIRTTAYVKSAVNGGEITLKKWPFSQLKLCQKPSLNFFFDDKEMGEFKCKPTEVGLTCGRTCEPCPSSASRLQTERPSSLAQHPSLNKSTQHWWRIFFSWRLLRT